MLSEMAVAAIRTSRLSKDYGAGRGLFDLDLEVAAHEIFGCLGADASGKTTAMRLLMGLIRPSAGSAHVFGLDCLRDGAQVRRRTGYLAGDLPDFGGLRGTEIVAYLAGLRRGVDRRRVHQLADRFDLDLGQRHREASSAARQALAIVLAFMHRPELLLLDEPARGLDPLHRRELYALVRQSRDEGATVFLAAPSVDEVEHVCDRAAILRDGRLVTVTRLDELRRISVHRVEIEFVAGSEIPLASLRAAAGVEDVSVIEDRVRCTVMGDFEGLLAAIRDSRVAEMVSTEPSVEETFLGYLSERNVKRLPA